MTNTLQPDKDGERIDAFLARTYPDYSRSFFQKLIKNGGVYRQGAKKEPLDVSNKVRLGDTIIVDLPEVLERQTPDFEVIYEDDDVVVINKPDGILTHAKGEAYSEATVADFVLPRTSVGRDTNRPGIVHRLDRATSGVMIAAKTPAAQSWLQKQFSQRRVKKTYIALVEGTPKEPAAIIRLPIERNPKKPQTFRVGKNGKPAETAYETMHNYRSNTLLKLMPHTGRTHQLRVHLHYIGCPIVGDTLYGAVEPRLGRMFLHAYSLELTLPSRERKVFTVPLTAQLQKYVDDLK